ncbi:hypothetical protein B484DRAFT_445601 [Ochromonadaceae sp. CCMP2298]|nr:hypothetical protein B484DRAFT_445601 [Ochromonadaceae sp. CCMP2298]
MSPYLLVFYPPSSYILRVYCLLFPPHCSLRAVLPCCHAAVLSCCPVTCSLPRASTHTLPRPHSRPLPRSPPRPSSAVQDSPFPPFYPSPPPPSPLSGNPPPSSPSSWKHGMGRSEAAGELRNADELKYLPLPEFGEWNGHSECVLLVGVEAT